MKLIIFKSQYGPVAINPDMVTSVSVHATNADFTVVAFAGNEHDYYVVEEPWRAVVAKLTDESREPRGYAAKPPPPGSEPW